MDLDTFFGLEKIVKELLTLVNNDVPEGLVIGFIHIMIGALSFVVSVLTSPFKIFRPLFSWLGAIWIQQTIMTVFFIGLAFWITRGDISMGRSFYLYSALLVLTIFVHADLSRLLPKGVLSTIKDHNGRIDFSFRTSGKIPKDS